MISHNPSSQILGVITTRLLQLPPRRNHQGPEHQDPGRSKHAARLIFKKTKRKSAQHLL